MLPVVWRKKAAKNLITIIDYISEKNFSAADALYDEIEQATSQLPQHPYLYRHGRVAGTRELVVHPNYLVVYRVTTSEIEIVAILHSRQKYP
jgi:toxin ParE1/3/4